MAEINEQTIKQYARIFADIFKQQGIMSANPASLASNSTGVQVDKSLNDYKQQKTKRKLLKDNNKLLEEYLSIQEDINQGLGDEEKQNKRRKKIENKLQDGSILLGQSYVSAANAIKAGNINASDINEFTSSEDLSKLSQDFSTNINEAGEVMSDAIVGTAEHFSTKTQRAIDKVFSMIHPGVMLAASFHQFVGEFRAGLKYGTDLSKGTITREFEALKMGISPKDLIELEAKNKRLVNAFGGAENFEKALSKGSSSMFKFYGDLGESTRGTVQSLHALSLGGIKPTMDMMTNQSGELSKLNKTFFDVRSMTGQTFAEQNAAMEEYIKSDNAKTKLAGLSNSKDRLAMIQREQSNKSLLAGLGLTADQAVKVSDAFNSITGLDPKERLKESYKAQAIAGAMGIKNAKIIGDVMRAGGINKVTEKVAAEYTQVMTQLSARQAKAVSGQITAQGLADNAIINHSSTLKAQIKASEDLILADKEKALAQKKKAEEELKNLNSNSGVKAITAGLHDLDILKTGLTSNSLLTGLLGLVGVIALGVRTGISVNRNRSGGLLNRTRDSFGRASSAISNRAGPMMQAGSRAMSAGATSILSTGKNILKFGGNLLGKAALPIAALSTISHGLDGWKEAASNFKGKEITVGMKAASALGGIVSGLAFGFIDSAKVAKTAHNMFAETEKVENKIIGSSITKLNPMVNMVKPIDNIKHAINERKEKKKSETAIDKTNIIQEQLLALQEKNSELMKTNNEILQQNFKLLHSANTKYLQSSIDIKTVLESNSDNSLSLSNFDDNSFVFT